MLGELLIARLASPNHSALSSKLLVPQYCLSLQVLRDHRLLALPPHLLSAHCGHSLDAWQVDYLLH